MGPPNLCEGLRLSDGQAVDQAARARVPLCVQASRQVERRLRSDVPVEDLAIVATRGDGVPRPGFRQAQHGAVVTVEAEQAPDTRISRFEMILYIFVCYAILLSQDHGVQRPAYQGGPARIVGPYDGAQRLLRHNVGQD